MMIRLISALLMITVLIAGFAAGTAMAADTDRIDDACEYMKTHRIHQDDIPRLRSAWLRDSRYNPLISANRDYRIAVSSLTSAVEAGDRERAVEICETHSADYCMLVLWNYQCSRAYEDLGLGDQAEFYRRASVGIGHWILKSGDGKSAESAFVVMDLLEQHFVQQVLGLRADSQSHFQKNGHHFDAVSAVKVETGESVTLFFDVDAMFAEYETPTPAGAAVE